ncbi:MAG: hypothetical protein MRY64_17245 [Hyphomonadaceae bacterium]|nr:hypothetical protein [Hyphomonadaceae bacterium]
MTKQPAASRRRLLAMIGGGLVVAVGAPSGVFLATRKPEDALRPWKLAGQYYHDPRLQALSYALLAPNPHNRQPWEAELVGDTELYLYRDKSRNLPVTDPYARQLTIGMGCFLELMEMAAGQEGFVLETRLFPDGEDGPVALCRFIHDEGRPDPLFKHVMNRRSHKSSFTTDLVEADVAAPLAEYASLYLGNEEHVQIREIAHDAYQTEVSTPEAFRESVDLLRLGKAAINASPDGIDVSGAMVDLAQMMNLIDPEQLYDASHAVNRDAIETSLAAILSAPASALVRTPGNSRTDQIEAGRRWLRLNLAATGLGLKLWPVSQALQEYDAVKPHFDALHQAFAPEGTRVQMLGLLGYGKQLPKSPRWRLETRMR